jgi:hypothetical protein
VNYGPVGSAPVGALWQSVRPQGSVIYESVSDGVTLSDSVSFSALIQASAVEAFSLGDSVLSVLTGANSVSDGFSALDSVLSQLTGFNIVGEEFTLGDEILEIDFTEGAERIPVPVVSRYMRVPQQDREQVVPVFTEYADVMRVPAEHRTMKVRSDMSKFLGTFFKQPNEVKDYDIDYTDFLAEILPPVSLATCEVIVECLNGDDTSLTNSLNVINTPVVKVWLSGGTHGYDYKLTARTTMTGTPARVDEREFKIKIREI